MPRIPITETSVGFNPAMQPTSSGDGYSAVGNAVKGLGNALGGLGDAFSAKIKEEDDFRDKLAELEWTNKQSEQSIKQRTEWNGDDPDGTALNWHAQRTQSFNSDLLPKMRTEEGRKRAQLRFASTGHNFYEQEMGWEAGQRTQKTITDTSSAITNMFKSVELDDPSSVDGKIAGALAGIDGIIRSKVLPEGQKRALAAEAANLAINKLREVYTKADKLEEFYPAMQKMLQGRVMTAPSNAPASGGSAGRAEVKSGMVQVAGLAIENGVNPSSPYMSRGRDVKSVSRIIMHGDVNDDADRLLKYGQRVDENRGFDPNYHFYIRKDGSVIQGVPIDRRANHTLNENHDSIGIVVAGADNGKQPTPAQERAAKTLISSLGRSMGIDPKNVNGHGELQPGRRHREEGGRIAADIRSGGFLPEGAGPTVAGLKQEPSQAARPEGPRPMAQRGITAYAGLTPPSQAQAAQTARTGILTSLDDSPTADEIVKSGASVVDFDFAKSGSKEAIAAAKKAGVKIAAYHEGAGGGPSWKEGNRDLNSPSVRAKFSSDVKRLAAEGADYIHVDNIDKLSPDKIAAVAKTVKEAGVTMIAKNNPAAWVEIIKKNPDLKPPYAVIEHGMKDKATQAAAKQLSDMGVPVHFVEFADPGTDQATKQKRKDPTSTGDEAAAFVKANPWAQVTHMRTQDAYNGREVAGSKTYRADNTIPTAGGAEPQAGPIRVADASGKMVPQPQLGGATKEFAESLIKNMDQYAREHKGTQDRWITAAGNEIKRVLDLADKVYAKMEDMDRIDALIATKPELAAKAGLPEAARGARAYLAEVKVLSALRPVDIAGVISDVERGIRTADIDAPTRQSALARKERLDKLLNEVKKAVDNDPMSYAARINLEVPTGDLVARGTADEFGRPVSQGTRLIEIKKLDFSSRNKSLDVDLIQRFDAARDVARYYNQPVQAFTEAERGALKDMMSNGGPEMVLMLGRIVEHAGPDAQSVIREFSKDAPEAFMVGKLMVEGGDTKLIEDASNEMKRRAVEKDKYVNRVDKVLASPDLADTLPVLAKTPGLADPVEHLTNAIYNYRHRYLGKDKFDPALYKKTMREVLGERTDKSGTVYGGVGSQSTGWFSSSKVLVPNEIRQDSFADMKNAVRSEDFAKIGTPQRSDGTPLSIRDVQQATWHSVGNGRYVIQTGQDGDDTAIYARGADGKAFVLDIKTVLPAIRQRKPAIFGQ